MQSGTPLFGRVYSIRDRVNREMERQEPDVVSGITCSALTKAGIGLTSFSDCANNECDVANRILRAGQLCFDSLPSRSINNAGPTGDAPYRGSAYNVAVLQLDGRTTDQKGGGVIIERREKWLRN